MRMSTKNPCHRAAVNHRGAPRPARWLLPCSVVLALLGAPSPAVAEQAPPTAEQPAADADIEQARQLFREATALEADGQWAAAVERLKRAVSIKETPGLRYHLAFAEEQLGQLLAARDNYRRADELIRSGISAPDVEAHLEPALQRIEQRLPRLTVVLPRDVPDAGVVVDGRPIANKTEPIALDPGTHELHVRAPDRTPFTRRITLAEGSRQQVAVSLPKIPAPTSVESAEASGSGSNVRTFVLAGEAVLTLAALTVGVGYTIERSNARDRIDRARAAIDRRDPSRGACAPDTTLVAECAELHAAIDDYNDAGRLSTAGFIAAGVGAVATAATWFLWDTESTNVSLDVGPTAWSVGWRQRF